MGKHLDAQIKQENHARHIKIVHSLEDLDCPVCQEKKNFVIKKQKVPVTKDQPNKHLVSINLTCHNCELIAKTYVLPDSKDEIDAYCMLYDLIYGVKIQRCTNPPVERTKRFRVYIGKEAAQELGYPISEPFQAPIEVVEWAFTKEDAIRQFAHKQRKVCPTLSAFLSAEELPGIKPVFRVRYTPSIAKHAPKKLPPLPYKPTLGMPQRAFNFDLTRQEPSAPTDEDIRIIQAMGKEVEM